MDTDSTASTAILVARNSRIRFTNASPGIRDQAHSMGVPARRFKGAAARMCTAVDERSSMTTDDPAPPQPLAPVLAAPLLAGLAGARLAAAGLPAARTRRSSPLGRGARPADLPGCCPAGGASPPVNLRLCFPDLSAAERARLLRAHFASLGMTLMEQGLAWWSERRRFRRAASACAVPSTCTRRSPPGRGVVLLTGHFGAQEFTVRSCGPLSPALGGLYRPEPATRSWMRSCGASGPGPPAC